MNFACKFALRPDRAAKPRTLAGRALVSRLWAQWRLLPLLLLTACGQGDALQALEEAHQFFARAEYSQAIPAYKTYLQKFPDDKTARYFLGLSYLESGDARSAYANLRRARAHGYDSGEVQVPLLQSLLLQEDFEAALDESARIVSPTPDVVWAQRGDAHMALNRLEQAENDFRTALELNPENLSAGLGFARIALIHGNLEEARPAIMQRLDQSRDAWVLKGFLELLENASQAAEQSFHTALQQQPGHTEAQLGLVRTYLAQARTAEAEQLLRRLLEQDPDLISAHYLLALSALSKGDTATAMQRAREVLSRDPNHVPTQAIIGAAHYDQENLEQANLYLERYLQAQPDDDAARLTLAITQLRLGQARLSLAGLNHLARSSNREPIVDVLTGAALLAERRVEKANDHLRMLAESDDPAARSLAVFGQVLEGKSEPLVQDFQAQVQKMPSGEKVLETADEVPGGNHTASLSLQNQIQEAMGLGSANEKPSSTETGCEGADRHRSDCRSFDAEVQAILKALDVMAAPARPTPGAEPGQTPARELSLPRDLVNRAVREQVGKLTATRTASRANGSALLQMDTRHAPSMLVSSRRAVNEGKREPGVHRAATGRQTGTAGRSPRPESAANFAIEEESEQDRAERNKDRPAILILFSELYHGMVWIRQNIRDHPWWWALGLGLVLAATYRWYPRRKPQ